MEVKEAVKKAREYIQEIYSDEHVNDIRLEEVEYEHHENAWNVTLSFSRPAAGLQQIVGAPRDYKTIVIDNPSRRVTAMRIRQLRNA